MHKNDTPGTPMYAEIRRVPVAVLPSGFASGLTEMF